MKVLSLLCLMFCCLLAARAVPAATTGSPPLKLLQKPQHAATAGAVQAPPAPTSFHDIEGPVGVAPALPHLILYALLGLAALLVLAGLGWWLLKRRTKSVPIIPPGMRARDELLRARALMTEDQALHYLERLSEILRRYIEARFNLQTTRQTTREFFTALSHNLVDNLSLAPFSKELRGCLERCDLAKFAHQSTSLDTLREMEDQVNNFIIRTEREPEQTAGERP